MGKRSTLWSGRFAEEPSALLRALNDSFAFDRELLAEDVTASIAWVAELRRAGALSEAERGKLTAALRQVGRAGVGSDAGEHEDVHTFLEAALRRRVGALAGKVHTGRSRNDQVAVAFRLWLRGAFATARAAVLDLADALARLAAREAGTVMPGYTHLKRAEPVTLGHWALAYVEMLLRDASRLEDAARRADECPLGAGALAGSPVAIDRARLAKALGFARPSANSLDAVSDRDAALDYLFAASLLLVHLSRLAEDLVFFTSDECRFAELPDALATGSSRMPQKKNPDLLELARGHAGRAIGELTGLLAVVKGIPLAYDKDLQLDKEPVFRVRRVLAALLPALAELATRLRVDRARLAEAAADDRLLATTLADALAERGVPFREAHEIVGRRWAEAERTARSLRALGPTREIAKADLERLDPGKIVAKRTVFGGTAPKRVAAAAAEARRRVAERRAPARKGGGG